jgi:rhodanese-related sulfurtransferase
MINGATPQQVHGLIARGEVEVIDVREPGEWSGGHIAGARLVPLNQLRANPKAALLRDGIVFVCAAGVRSMAAARIATSLGFERIYNLEGGTRAWLGAGLELVKDQLEVAI